MAIWSPDRIRREGTRNMSEQDAWDTYYAGRRRGGDLEWASKEAYERAWELIRQGQPSVWAAAGEGFLQGLEENFERIKRFVPHKTSWSFVTSAGADLNVSPWLVAGFVFSGGALYVKRNGDPTVHTLRYGGIGASIGVQIVPLPFNFDFALKQMPSSGVIYTGPLTGGELTLSKFYGPCLIYQASLQAGPGYSAMLVLMGAKRAHLTPGPTLPAAAFLSCQAIVAFHGMNINLLPWGAGASAALGEVFGP